MTILFFCEGCGGSVDADDAGDDFDCDTTGPVCLDCQRKRPPAEPARCADLRVALTAELARQEAIKTRQEAELARLRAKEARLTAEFAGLMAGIPRKRDRRMTRMPL
jgi:hypothetical protein